MTANKKRTVLITGNGFDLAHDLPTSYSDFMTVMKVLAAKDKLSDVDLDQLTFDDLFPENENQKQWRENVQLHYRTSEMILNLAKIKPLLNNVWLKCFEHIIVVQTWIDFETEIAKILDNVGDFIKKCNEHVSNGNQLHAIQAQAKSTLASGEMFYANIDCKNICNLGLIKVRFAGNEWSPEIPQFIIKTDYIAADGNINQNKIFRLMCDGFEEFCCLFSLYLNQVVGSFIDCINHEQLSKPPELACNLVFTFNYTNTFQKLYLPTSNSVAEGTLSTEVIHLHGALNSPNDNGIVLGVNEVAESHIFGVPAKIFTKYYQTLFKNTRSAFLRDPNIFDLSNDTEYVIWGHSLDRSDQKYIKQIFEAFNNVLPKLGNGGWSDHFATIDKQPSIRIYYYAISEKAKLLQNLLSIVGQENIEKLSYAGLLKFKSCPNIWKEPSE